MLPREDPRSAPGKLREERPALAGSSPAVASLRALVGLAARARGPVLVAGETGTGKSLVARCVHAASRGPAAPLVTLHGPAMSRERTDFERWFARARGGSVLLDEVSEMPLADQDALLIARRAHAAEGEGAARCLATTRADLADLVGRGWFREELYLLLGGFRIELPPLRARLGDLPVLTDLFLERAWRHGVWPSLSRPQLTPRALVALAAHPWPGNVRELENVVERIAFATDGGPIDAETVRGALGAWPVKAR